MAVTTTYTLGTTRLDAPDPAPTGLAIDILCQHAVSMGFTITGVGIGTGAAQGMLRVTITKGVAFTAAELAHLGLS